MQKSVFYKWQREAVPISDMLYNMLNKSLSHYNKTYTIDKTDY